MLETSVTDCRYLVDSIGIEFNRHAQPKRQPSALAGGVGVSRHVEMLSELCEFLGETDTVVDLRPVDARDEAAIVLATERAAEPSREADWPRICASTADRAAVRLLGASDY